jgi:hypothetical protein
MRSHIFRKGSELALCRFGARWSNTPLDDDIPVCEDCLEAQRLIPPSQEHHGRVAELSHQ